MPFPIDVWSDLACPWCYIGKRRLEAALPRVSELGEVTVTWHAFELDPSAARSQEHAISYAERLAKKYGQSRAQAEQVLARIAAAGREEGLEFRFDRIRPGNTFDAHRLLAHAKLAGQQHVAAERLFQGYFSEGRSLSDPGELVGMANDAGLDADAVSGLLASDQYAEEVRSDEREASELGIHAVPFFVFDRRFAVSGAQPPGVFVQALERALQERAPVDPTAGATCGPAGC